MGMNGSSFLATLSTENPVLLCTTAKRPRPPGSEVMRSVPAVEISAIRRSLNYNLGNYASSAVVGP